VSKHHCVAEKHALCSNRLFVYTDFVISIFKKLPRINNIVSCAQGFNFAYHSIVVQKLMPNTPSSCLILGITLFKPRRSMTAQGRAKEIYGAAQIEQQTVCFRMLLVTERHGL